MLRLRMLAVKNSMKRSLVSAPAAVIAAGSDSMPTRMSAGGAATTSLAVKIMSSLGVSDTGSMVSSPSPFVYHKGRYDCLNTLYRLPQRHRYAVITLAFLKTTVRPFARLARWSRSSLSG